VLANERSRRDYATANGYKNYGDVRAETGGVELDKVTVDELVAREVMMHRLVRQGLDRRVRDPRARNAHEILQKTRGFDATQFVRNSTAFSIVFIHSKCPWLVHIFLSEVLPEMPSEM